ncbi:MAG: hypothetical protein ACLQVM_18080 [Terriglobia bacterium]
MTCPYGQPRAAYFLSPRWGLVEIEALLTPGLAPWAKIFQPSGPLPFC